LYNILIEVGVPMKLIRLIKMCLNETYSKVKEFSCPKWTKTRRCSITTAFELCLIICHQEGPGKSGGTETKWHTSASGLR
jgi:hypothetical protein